MNRVAKTNSTKKASGIINKDDRPVAPPTTKWIPTSKSQQNVRQAVKPKQTDMDFLDEQINFTNMSNIVQSPIILPLPESPVKAQEYNVSLSSQHKSLSLSPAGNQPTQKITQLESFNAALVQENSEMKEQLSQALKEIKLLKLKAAKAEKTTKSAINEADLHDVSHILTQQVGKSPVNPFYCSEKARTSPLVNSNMDGSQLQKSLWKLDQQKKELESKNDGLSKSIMSLKQQGTDIDVMQLKIQLQAAQQKIVELQLEHQSRSFGAYPQYKIPAWQ